MPGGARAQSQPVSGLLFAAAAATGCGSGEKYIAGRLDASADAVTAQGQSDTAGPDSDSRGISFDAGPPLVPGAVCTGDGWCWMNPLPAGGTGQSWSLSQDDAWVVGRSGLVLRWSRGSWSFSESGTTANLAAVWAADGTDAWAVGAGGTLLHWDGAAWTTVASPASGDLYAVHGSGHGDVWAAGSAGSLLHWDGTSWSSFGVPDAGTVGIRGVWAASRTAAWAVGSPGILRWDGRAWATVPGSLTFDAIWGLSTDDVWVVGPSQVPADMDVVLARAPSAHWNGSTWTFPPSPPSGGPVIPPMSAGLSLSGVWGSRSDDVWATADSNAPLLQHWDGGAWGLLTAPAPSFAAARLGGGTGSVFAGLWHLEGSSWVDRGADAISTPAGSSVDGIWLSSSSDGWILDTYGALHWDGSALSRSLSPPSGAALYGVHGTGPDDVWAVGYQGLVEHWDGAKWSASHIDSTSYLRAVWAAAPNDVWVIAYDTIHDAVWHWDGSAWTTSLALSSDPYGLWGSASDDVWVGTDDGKMSHWDGAAWTSITTPAANLSGFRAISGSGKNDVWAACGFGIVHWDGSTWTVSATSGQYTALTARAPDDVWAVGYQGLITHWNGTAWTSSTVHGMDRTEMDAAFALPDGTTWIGGVDGVLLRRTP